MKKSLFNRCFACSVIAAIGTVIIATDARSAVIFTETAGNAFYDSGWSSGSSQPGNFSWVVTTNVTNPGYAGHFIGDSTNLSGGSSGGNVNTVGRSLGMYGSVGGGGFGEAEAVGLLKDGAGNNASLSVGQTLALDIAVNFRNGFKGVAMRDSGNAELFTFNIGGDDYSVLNASTGNGSIGNAYSNNTVFRIAMNQTSAGGGTWEITRSGGASDFDTGNYSGVISNFKLYVSQTGVGSENDLMANNISVVPEPGSAGLLLVGSWLLTVFRRRR